jgi:hypothetical protein
MNVDVPPPLIDCARVLRYASVDDSVRYTPQEKLIVDGVEMGAVPRLAVVRNLVDDSVMLLHCDEAWNSLAVSGGDSIDDVTAYANHRYEGLAGKWNDAPYSDADYARAVCDEHGNDRCSFCARFSFEIDALMIQGNRAKICGDCVYRLHSIFAENAETQL